MACWTFNWPCPSDKSWAAPHFSLFILYVQFPARGVGEVNGVSVRVVPLHSSNKNWGEAQSRPIHGDIYNFIQLIWYFWNGEGLGFCLFTTK